MRILGLDIHCSFAAVVTLEDGVLSMRGRVDIARRHLAAFAMRLRRDDEVVRKATGNAMAVAEVLRPHVGRGVIANPREVRLITQAKIKTDRIGAAVLAQLHASGFLPAAHPCGSSAEGALRRNRVLAGRAR